MKQLYLILILTFLFSNTFSQNIEKVDSLKKELIRTINKKDIADIYFKLSNEMAGMDIDTAEFYANKCMKLSENINYKKGIANSYLSLGKIMTLMGTFDESINQTIKALEYFEEKEDSTNIGKCYLNLGYTYFVLEKFDKALYYNQLSLRFISTENYKDHKDAYNNIGVAYRSMSRQDSALFYFQKSINLSLINKDKDIIYELGNIANIYLDNKEFKKALFFFKKVIRLSANTRNKEVLFIAYCNISITNRRIATQNKKEANLYYKRAIEYGDSALHLAKNINSLIYKSYAYQVLYSAYKEKKDFKKAYFNLEKYIDIKDSLFNIKKVSEIEKIEKQYLTAKQKIEIENYKKETELSNKLIKKQDQIILVGIVAIFIIVTLLVLLMLLYKKKNLANIKLNYKNEEITNQRDKLSKLAFELKKSNKTKNKFISILAHDLKNPFQSILGFSELLKDQAAEKKFENTQKFSEYIYNTARETYNLLENLLDWARAQKGLMKYKPKEVKISNLINKSVEVIKNSAVAKNITIVVKCDNTAEAFIDSFMILTVIRNLISNAIKFTERNGTIQIFSEDGNKYITLIVKDNGVGIKKEKIPKLFMVDKAISTVGTENERGAGFGLSICMDLVKKNNGTIAVESKIGEGSSFIVTLPKSSLGN